jgi:tryptophan synthase beta subunit
MTASGEHEFGEFGGQYVPEPLVEPLAELMDAFEEIVPTDASVRTHGSCTESETRGVEHPSAAVGLSRKATARTRGATR